MTFDLFTLTWLILGGALILLELAIPGLVVIFFGLSAVIIGLAAGLGLIKSWGLALLAWSLTSAGLVMGVRMGGKRLSPGVREKALPDEELDAFGKRVEVVEMVGPNLEGRIRFRGTTWPARALDEELAAGTFARIVTRDNLVWIVERDSDLVLDAGR